MFPWLIRFVCFFLFVCCRSLHALCSSDLIWFNHEREKSFRLIFQLKGPVFPKCLHLEEAPKLVFQRSPFPLSLGDILKCHSSEALRVRWYDGEMGAEQRDQKNPQEGFFFHGLLSGLERKRSVLAASRGTSQKTQLCNGCLRPCSFSCVLSQ